MTIGVQNQKIHKMKLSKNLKLSEVTRSGTAKRLGISNEPTDEHLENLKLVSMEIFQRVRDHFGVPIFVSSGYRSAALNKKIGGSKTSDHLKGMALDLDADVFGGITNADIFYYIKRNLPFKQLIWEFGTADNPNWVHVSFDKDNNKGEVLRATKKGHSVWGS